MRTGQRRLISEAQPPTFGLHRKNVETILRKGGLGDRRRLLVRMLSDDSAFNDPAKYRQFRLAALRYLRSDDSKLNDRQVEVMVKLRR